MIHWLDKNGWLHRKAKVINTRNHAVYEITLDIAKSEDGRTILYATNGNIKRIGNANGNSTANAEGPRQNTYSKNNISHDDDSVNPHFLAYKSDNTADDGLWEVFDYTDIITHQT